MNEAELNMLAFCQDWSMRAMSRARLITAFHLEDWTYPQFLLVAKGANAFRPSMGILEFADDFYKAYNDID